MKKFIGAKIKNCKGFPMCSTGCSVSDNEDYCVESYYLKGDEVPEPMEDAKDSAYFIAGLLNMYYNGLDASQRTVDDIINSGKEIEAVPGPQNPTLPF